MALQPGPLPPHEMRRFEERPWGGTLSCGFSLSVRLPEFKIQRYVSVAKGELGKGCVSRCV